MVDDNFERLLRWAERLAGDLILSSPTILTWEMVSRIQRANAYPYPIPSPLIYIQNKYLNDMLPIGTLGTGGQNQIGTTAPGGGGTPPATAYVLNLKDSAGAIVTMGYFAPTAGGTPAYTLNAQGQTGNIGISYPSLVWTFLGFPAVTFTGPFQASGLTYTLTLPFVGPG